ncbi:MurR/RpiR family transcriptional regulator [Planococcus sp. YIM B11945]|uniref:MurR/RpiR family transcriptional regulator n=1 Tax=Planococcus sp. YIM B11945 TaxID=3435410 RepID=UPI003D7ECA90
MRNIESSYKSFSSGQKKVCDLFFQEPIYLAFSSALEVGRRVNVSESTVIRWAQKLGYRGYAEFQQVLQRKLAEERLGKIEQEKLEPDEKSFLENLLDADISSLVKMKKSIDEEKLLQIVEAISRAERIYITSNFFDFGLAHWFSTWLNLALGFSELLMPSDSRYFSVLSKLEATDVVIAFAFPRYTKAVMETLKTAKEAGAEVVVLTDSLESPAVAYSDIAIAVSVNSNLNIDSYTAVHALLTSIMRFVYVKEHAKVKGNLMDLEAVYRDKDVFY